METMQSDYRLSLKRYVILFHWLLYNLYSYSVLKLLKRTRDGLIYFYIFMYIYYDIIKSLLTLFLITLMIDFASHSELNCLNRLHPLLQTRWWTTTTTKTMILKTLTRQTSGTTRRKKKKRETSVRRSLPTGYLEHGRSVPSAPWTRTR